MGAYIMKSNFGRQLLIREVQEAFSGRYPYLKIDFTRGKAEKMVAGAAAPVLQDQSLSEASLAARELLWNEFGISDDMKVNELEVLLQYEFGRPAQILRKSGNLWLETRMTQHWTLRDQNDHGRDIGLGFPS
jgi:hypothetical protein